MEFSNAIPFANTRTIWKVNGFSSIAYETYLKQTIRRVGNRLHAPDCQGKPLPKRPDSIQGLRSGEELAFCGSHWYHAFRVLLRQRPPLKTLQRQRVQRLRDSQIEFDQIRRR